ncbi:hypothetical protein [Nonomuraea sp. NPDC049028]|uniref:hypothetical protein n=1 Tax=Nonomuraea sp. NPDC049028 TaxID=3364348 RepID=UPI003718195F
MRVVTWAGVDRLAQEEVPAPEIASGQVLVRVSRVGICGSDLAILSGQELARMLTPDACEG